MALPKLPVQTNGNVRHGQRTSRLQPTFQLHRIGVSNPEVWLLLEFIADCMLREDCRVEVVRVPAECVSASSCDRWDRSTRV